MKRFIDWVMRSGGLFMLGIAGLVLLMLALSGCDSGDGSCNGDCELPEYLCGQPADHCLMPFSNNEVCCLYGDGFADDCQCTMCVMYPDELSAEKALEESLALIGSE